MKQKKPSQRKPNMDANQERKATWTSEKRPRSASPKEHKPKLKVKKVIEVTEPGEIVFGEHKRGTNHCSCPPREVSFFRFSLLTEWNDWAFVASIDS